MTTPSAFSSCRISLALVLLLTCQSSAWVLPSHNISPSRTSTRLSATTDSDLARLRLEMHWTMAESAQDCLVDDPKTCGSAECTSCRGAGTHSCRFCRGTKQVYMGGNFLACPICDSHGLEDCHDCQGTGWVAEWTQINGDPEKDTKEVKP
ncbi:expressed unknown protein [Seminavis robusta]|uniref:Uncharacterized protein n=1 Tax=Seminavis robusta TaxID=568900 RepID=A0A9N8HBY2_9STRA|nr:expressed unknown protein [Seminavis robusta]|eukprot:Sro356_g125280.1 n/a (151) ;mRNA; r:18657-19109